MQKFAADAAALMVIAALVIGFFFRLFFPVPQLIVTPDFGRSDSWHFSFATKYLLGQSLHRSQLPLWSSTMGTGFPLIGEGQIGAFFLPNFLIFRLFNAVTAYNLALTLAVLTLGWGMYVWLRLMRYDAIPSIFAATTLSFSGMVIAQLTHIALIQGFSLFPWIAAATILLGQRNTPASIFLWALLSSQQLLAGFPQASFVTMLFAAAYYVWLIRKNKTKYTDIARFLVAAAGAVGLSAIQLLPSFEFLKQTTAAGGLQPETASYFSYPLKHLLTLIVPFALGNPKMGTYPAFFRFDGGIFWENVGAIGPLPIVLFFVFLIMNVVLTSKKERVHAYYTLRVEMRLRLFFFSTALVSLLLMLGKYSPLYLVYSFFPFNLFRVPSRFIWIFVPVILILAAEGWTRLWQVKTYRTGFRAALVAAAALNTIFLISTWYSYHGIEPAAKWLTLPEVALDLPVQSRIRSVGSEAVHNQTFLSSGWQTLGSYRFMRNALAPNSNVYWNIPNAGVYAGRFLRRSTILDTLISRELTFDEQAATLSALGNKLLDLAGVEVLVASLPLTQHGLTPLISTASAGITITAWKNPTAVPRAYLATKPVSAETKEQAYMSLSRKDFTAGESVLVETDALRAGTRQTGTAEVSVTQIRDTEIIISVTGNTENAILVLSDTYYPGWTATLNGREIPISPVNIQYMGVAVPQGDHLVRFRYIPKSLIAGGWISGLTLLFLMGQWVFPAFSVTARIVKKVRWPGRGHRRNHGR